MPGSGKGKIIRAVHGIPAYCSWTKDGDSGLGTGITMAINLCALVDKAPPWT